MLQIAIYKRVSTTTLFHGHYHKVPYYHFLKCIFTGYQIQVSSYFKKQFTNVISLVFCLPRCYFEKSVISVTPLQGERVCVRVHVHTCMRVYVCMCVYFQVAFKIFSVFDFQKFEYNASRQVEFPPAPFSCSIC